MTQSYDMTSLSQFLSGLVFVCIAERVSLPSWRSSASLSPLWTLVRILLHQGSHGHPHSWIPNVADMGCEDSDAPNESCRAKLFQNVPTCQGVLSILAVLDSEDVRLSTERKVLGSWPKLTPRIWRKTATTTSICGMTTTLPLRVSSAPIYCEFNWLFVHALDYQNSPFM
jgi:hypothetical protein